MSLFNFKSLINSYSKDTVKAIYTTEGHYDTDNGGKWVDGEKIEEILNSAAIVPLSQDDLKFDVGGTFNSDGRKLYCYKKLIKGALIESVQRDGTKRTYKIMQEKDYSSFDTGLHIYLMLRGDRDDSEA